MLTPALRQTWEDPQATHPETKAKGDNDPLDVCEIGEQVGYTGQVKQVKVLGIMALRDEGETDWKVIVVDVNDPLASKLNDIEDVENNLPGLIRATNEWFRYVYVASRDSQCSTDRRGFAASTRSPMASPRTSLRSSARRRTRSMPPRSSTSATRPGAGSTLAKAPPRRRPTTSPCALFSSILHDVRELNPESTA